MKKTYLILVTITVLMIAIFIPKIEYAAGFSADSMIQDANSFIDKGKNQAGDTYDNDIKDTFVPIAQILVNIGGGIIAIVTAIMAIKYMTTNAEGKAKLKTQLIGLVIATCVIFGAQMIWATLYEVLKDI